MKIVPDQWAALSTLETPILELITRAAVLYFFILVMMRLMPRRTGGELATMDLVLVLLITNAAANALGDYSSLTDGVALIAVIMALNYLVNFISYYLPWIEWLISSPPLQIIRDGKMLRRNMRREFITEEELISHLRLRGIDDIKDVKIAYVESEGQISVVHKRHKHS